MNIGPFRDNSENSECLRFIVQQKSFLFLFSFTFTHQIFIVSLLYILFQATLPINKRTMIPYLLREIYVTPYTEVKERQLRRAFFSEEPTPLDVFQSN